MYILRKMHVNMIKCANSQPGTRLCIVGKGKKKWRRSPFPSPEHQWAGFTRRSFSFLTLLFAFSHHCGAWSKASKQLNSMSPQFVGLQGHSVQPLQYTGKKCVSRLVLLQVLFAEATFLFRHVLNATSKYSDDLSMNPENKRK